MIDLTDILQAVLALLAAIITKKLIPLIKARTTQEQQSALLSMTSVLVFAAEKMYGAGHGADKLDYVIRELEERGYTADRAAIEAVIKEHAEKLHSKPRETDGADYIAADEPEEDEEPQTPLM